MYRFFWNKYQKQSKYINFSKNSVDMILKFRYIYNRESITKNS